MRTVSSELEILEVDFSEAPVEEKGPNPLTSMTEESQREYLEELENVIAAQREGVEASTTLLVY